MNWISLIIVAGAVVVFFLVRMSMQISFKAARDHLKRGAAVIDVRSAGEYTAGHLTHAMNMPVSEIEAILPRKVPEKEKVLLLYCQSGVRSGIAKRKMKEMGYTNAYNLGSYRRALHIVLGD